MSIDESCCAGSDGPMTMGCLKYSRSTYSKTKCKGKEPLDTHDSTVSCATS